MAVGTVDSLAKLQVLEAEIERLSYRDPRALARSQQLISDLQQELESLTRQRQELASLYAVAQELTAATDLDELLQSVVDRAIVLVRAERGFAVLVEPGGGWHIAAARRFSAGEVAPTDEAFSSSLVERVMQSGEPILTKNVQDDGRFELTQSIILHDIRSVIAVPLLARGELQGAIYVDTRASVRFFSEDDLRLLQAMASQAAMAIRGARLYEDTVRSNSELQAALGQLREAQDQLLQSERLAAVGRLAASVAHELRSPLMVMRNSIYYLDRLLSLNQGDADTWRRYLGKMNGEIDRQSKIINDLLFFSRNRPRQLANVEMNELLREALHRTLIPESIVLETAFAEGLGSIRADADQMLQVFVNLISNAVQAMPDGGRLQITTSAPDEYAIEISVADTGVGIPPENLARLFEPFFTTKEKGIGLGLSVTQNIIEGHRGTLAVQSAVGEGTRFSVRLPRELIG
jgi:signal transduction histidine kinase